MVEKYEILEFEGEYLGGHVNYPRKCSVLLRLDDKKIDVVPQKLWMNKLTSEHPAISILYESISSIQNVPEEKISSLRFLVLGPIPGLLWRKKEFYLHLTFKDKDGADMDQNMVFKMKGSVETYQAIYEEVAYAKRNKKQSKRRKET